MMKRNKKFQIFFEMGDSAIFDATNKTKDVDEWVRAFHKKGVVGSSLKIFSVGNDGTYTLIHSEACVDDCDEEMRPVGFGRWQS